MNRIFLLGRLVRDPEVRVTPTERTVCTFTLAVDRPFTAKNGQREADFINIVTWNKTAELCGNSLLKGQRALVEGRLQIRSRQHAFPERKCPEPRGHGKLWLSHGF